MSWADRFSTHSEACIYYGVDTPEQIRAEIAADAAEEAAYMAEMVAAFGPYVFPEYLFLDIPF